MPKITYQDNQGNSKTIEVENGLTVMEGAIQNDIPGIDADCGGSMACATCHVYVEEKGLSKLPQAEDGIRDSSTSRGLGDVYKRQRLGCIPIRLYLRIFNWWSRR